MIHESSMATDFLAGLIACGIFGVLGFLINCLPGRRKVEKAPLQDADSTRE